MTAETPTPAAGPEVCLTQAAPGLKKLLIGAGWDFTGYDGEPMDVDLCCFVLGRDGQTREDEDFVFYNNPAGAQLSIKHLGDNRTGAGDGDDEAIMVDLDSLSFDVWRIIFVAAIYQGDQNDQSFAQLGKLTLRVEDADGGQEIHRLVLDGAKAGKVTAVRIAEIYRNGVEWFFVPQAEGIEGGLAEAARGYGILISSTT